MSDCVCVCMCVCFCSVDDTDIWKYYSTTSMAYTFIELWWMVKPKNEISTFLLRAINPLEMHFAFQIISGYLKTKQNIWLEKWLSE